jgi:hypothetical protein
MCVFNKRTQLIMHRNHQPEVSLFILDKRGWKKFFLIIPRRFLKNSMPRFLGAYCFASHAFLQTCNYYFD